MPTLTSQQRAHIRRRSKYHEPDPSELAGELNIIPFLDIVVNLIMFLLATAEAVLLIAQIESDLPRIARGRASNQPIQTPLNLNVTVTDAGALVTGSGGKLAPGCTDIDAPGSRSVTVARKGKDYDWSGLTECVNRIKGTYKDEDTVTVSADPQIEYEHVVAAMDAVRRKGTQDLFPHVLISVGVR
jgi:biopolymer transport protein TolR